MTKSNRHTYYADDAKIKSIETVLYLMSKAGIESTDFCFTMHITEDQWFKFLKLIDQHYGIQRTDEERSLYSSSYEVMR